jgi:hypothetical protein
MAAARLYQFQKFLVQNLIAEKVSQSNDGLLYRFDAFHHLDALAHKLAQFPVCGLYYYLKVRI